MIPERFVTEYPERCGQLLDMLERPARDADVLGSFALLVASAAFTIPFGRMVEKAHPLGKPEDALYDAIEGLKKVSFVSAPFWNGAKPAFFRYAKIVTDAEDSIGWRDAKGEHPLNSSEAKDANIILRTIRNALAHGNTSMHPAIFWRSLIRRTPISSWRFPTRSLISWQRSPTR
jgi:hypothetical protein